MEKDQQLGTRVMVVPKLCRGEVRNGHLACVRSKERVTRITYTQTKAMFKKVVTLGCVLAVSLITAFAALTGSITISGSVFPSTEIEVTPQNNYNALSIEVGENNKIVAQVKYKCNNQLGYTVTLRSANAHADAGAVRLKGTGNNTDTISYSMQFDGNTVTPDQNGDAVLVNSDTKTSGYITKNLAVTTTPAPNVFADTYSDTLTFTISAK